MNIASNLLKPQVPSPVSLHGWTLQDLGGLRGRSSTTEPPSIAAHSVLGNPEAQVLHLTYETAISAVIHIRRAFREAPPAAKLAALKAEKFPAHGREQRIAKSLAALRRAQTLTLSVDQWREVFEEAESEGEG